MIQFGLPDFSDKHFRVGDRVVVEQTGRRGLIVGERIRHNGWKIQWDEPVFGVTHGRVATVFLIHERNLTESF